MFVGRPLFQNNGFYSTGLIPPLDDPSLPEEVRALLGQVLVVDPAVRMALAVDLYPTLWGLLTRLDSERHDESEQLRSATDTSLEKIRAMTVQLELAMMSLDLARATEASLRAQLAETTQLRGRLEEANTALKTKDAVIRDLKLQTIRATREDLLAIQESVELLSATVASATTTATTAASMARGSTEAWQAMQALISAANSLARTFANSERGVEAARATRGTYVEDKTFRFRADLHRFRGLILTAFILGNLAALVGGELADWFLGPPWALSRGGVLAFGAICSLIATLWRVLARRRFINTPEDINEHLGVRFLGMVPLVGGDSSAARAAALRNREGVIGETYRVLRTNLIFSSVESSGSVILVSSANPAEGKSTTAANLSIALALNGAKVVVIDADLRRSTLHEHFGLSKTPGLSDLIVGKCQASEAIHTTRFMGLQVLPCGYSAPNPAELLGSANMREVMKALRTCYDWVVIDTPPLLPLADTLILTPMVDGVVLVVSAEASSRIVVQRAIDQILSTGGKVTGVVLNKVDVMLNSYYYRRRYPAHFSDWVRR